MKEGGRDKRERVEVEGGTVEERGVPWGRFSYRPPVGSRLDFLRGHLYLSHSHKPPTCCVSSVPFCMCSSTGQAGAGARLSSYAPKTQLAQ